MSHEEQIFLPNCKGFLGNYFTSYEPATHYKV